MVSRRKKLRLYFQLLLALGLLLIVIASVAQLQVVRDFFSQASSIPANVYVNTKAVLGPLPRPWRNLAQGGESHAWRLAPISTEVAQLHPNYIRLDHVYDFYDVVQGQPGNLTLDFSKLDLVLEDIRSVGATPFLSLSYLPPLMSDDGNVTGKPNSYKDWQYLVQKTIEHVSGQKGFQDVYYEVWNEPDLFGGWKYYGSKNYLDLYAAAARGAAAANHTLAFKIGGPATTGLYQNWVDALLSSTSKNDLRLDFISWHRYTYDLDQYRVDMALARTWVAAYPKYNGVIEYLITEWGHNSEMDAGYDGMLGAAHTVASAITMVGTVEHGFIFEIQDGTSDTGKAYWGRWGLFTANEHGAKPKPRYWALRLLDSLGPQRLQVLGQGSQVKALATKDESGKIQTILANFDPRGTNHETVPITFQAVDPGTFELKLKYLSGDTRTQTIATTAATLRTLVPLGPNDVVMAELTHQ